MSLYATFSFPSQGAIKVPPARIREADSPTAASLCLILILFSCLCPDSEPVSWCILVVTVKQCYTRVRQVCKCLQACRRLNHLIISCVHSLLPPEVECCGREWDLERDCCYRVSIDKDLSPLHNQPVWQFGVSVERVGRCEVKSTCTKYVHCSGVTKSQVVTCGLSVSQITKVVRTEHKVSRTNSGCISQTKVSTCSGCTCQITQVVTSQKEGINRGSRCGS